MANNTAYEVQHTAPAVAVYLYKLDEWAMATLLRSKLRFSPPFLPHEIRRYQTFLTAFWKTYKFDLERVDNRGKKTKLVITGCFLVILGSQRKSSYRYFSFGKKYKT